MFYFPNKKMLKKEFFNDWVLNHFTDYTHRFEVYYGGGGSGKSYGAVQKMIFKCLGNKRKVLVVRKTRVSNKASMWELYRSILNDLGISYIQNKSELTITLSNGTQFLFFGIDDPEKIKSIPDITDIMIEEATELTLDDFTQLNLRLRHKTAKYQQIYLMFNPVSKLNWCFLKWFKNPSEHQKANTLIIHSTYQDNKFLNDIYRQELEDLSNSNPAYYKIYCLGEFATLERLVFPKYEKRIINVEELKGQGLKFWVGLDFGYVNDTTAIVWGYYDKQNRKLYITGEYGKTGMTNDKIAMVLKNLGFQKEVIIADSAEQKSIEEIKQLGLKRIKMCKKAPGSVMAGIDRLLWNDIIIDERCIKTIEEFENYHYIKDKNTGEYTNEVADEYNHFIDATRYGTEEVITKGGWGWKNKKH